jgi:hypothetical protein
LVSGDAGSSYQALVWTTVAHYHEFFYDELGRQWKDATRSLKSTLWAETVIYEGWAAWHYEGNALRRTGYASHNGLFHLLQDHLRSSSAIIHQNGVLRGRNYYYPYGGGIMR